MTYLYNRCSPNYRLEHRPSRHEVLAPQNIVRETLVGIQHLPPWKPCARRIEHAHGGHENMGISSPSGPASLGSPPSHELILLFCKLKITCQGTKDLNLTWRT